ncbi:MAG: hypothetical protein U5L45_16880 [Saprospiraceae bacterium]|nr:hypothetical protein [Saprospiraceae bacterium]
MARFSAKPKNEPHSPPSRERSEREMQKTLLGYAHPSITFFKKLLLASLANDSFANEASNRLSSYQKK